MKQIFNTFIILFSILCLSCIANNKKNIEEETSPKLNSIEKKDIYKKIEYFVDKYTIGKEENAINDSLCFYMAQLDKRELITDDSLRCIMAKLLEKKYLEVRNSGVFPKESFPVYNVSLLYESQTSNSFALNILFKETKNIDRSFVKYGNQLQGEFFCVDSVILEIDKLPQMKNDSNHQKCMYLVTNNMTGGCKW